MKLSISYSLLALVLSLQTSLLATTYYVDSTPTGVGNDGTSWPDAFANLQDALAIANTGDAIWVAAGTYYPDLGASQTDNAPTSTFQLETGVALYGGFQGLVTETALTDRDPSTYGSILSGDLLQNDGANFANNLDNAYHVVTGSGTDDTAILDGFTITAGYAAPYPGGGALYNDTGSPTLANCFFLGNSATDYGGAIYNTAASPTFTNCSFSGNSAAYGGAIANDFDATPTLSDCSLTNNTASDGGGALYSGYSTTTLTNCSLSGNSAANGGAIHSEGSTPTLTGCTLSDNSASNNGGAIYNSDRSTPTLTDCTLSGNSSVSGGAIYNDHSSPTLTRVSLTGNSASNEGGAIYNDFAFDNATLTDCFLSDNSAAYGGAIYNYANSDPTLTNCSLSGNSATIDGGAFYNFAPNSTSSQSSASPKLINCSLSGNSAANDGGAFYNNDDSSPTLINCSLSGNSAANDGGAFYNNGSSSPKLTSCSLSGNSSANDGGAFYNAASSPTLTNCILWNNQASSTTMSSSASVFNDNTSSPTYADCLIANSGGSASWATAIGTDSGRNIDIDPRFHTPIILSNVPTSEGDLRLVGVESPAIDAGNYVSYVGHAAGLTTDLAGNTRYYDDPGTTNTGYAGYFIDLGAYESYDFSRPSMDNYTLTTANTTDATALEFALTFNEEVFNLDDASDLIITTSGSAAYTDVTIIRIDGSSYTFSLNGTSGEGTFTIAIRTDSDVIDSTGNPMAANAGIDILRLSASSPVHYVNEANPNPAAPYNTWATAATDLQDVLPLARTLDQIWVATGIYTPDRGSAQTTGDRASTFQLKSGIAIYGGFQGLETDLTDRNPSSYSTTLSGDLMENDGANFTNNSDNAYHVVTGSGTDNTAILDGFTITAGNANGGAGSGNKGGALYNSTGSPTLTNCILSENTALNSGGAIYNDDSSPTLTHCSLSGNSAGSGGAIRNDHSSPTLTHCSLSGNSAANGGAIDNFGSSPTLTNCSLSDNSASNNGGAIYNYANGSRSSSSTTLTNCSLSGNSAGTYGGAINNYLSITTLTNCSLSGNSAADGGAIRNEFNSISTLTNCSLSGNSAATNGGAIYNQISDATLTNCSLSGNAAASDGGAIHNSSSSSTPAADAPSFSTLTNCILWGNAASGSTTNTSASVFNDIGSAPAYTSTSTYDHCLIANSGGSASWVAAIGTDDGNNIDVDPLFITPVVLANVPTTTADLRLGYSSPAINAGDDVSGSSVNTTTTELTDNPRFVGIIDLGAYEGAYTTFATRYPGLNSADDGNGNGRSNYADYALGLDPTVSSGSGSVTTLVGDLLTFSIRAYAADVVSVYKKSTDLSTWYPLVENVDYTYVETVNYGVQDQVTLELTPALLDEPKVFFTEAFTTE
jgi:parallel beta-helix repeat protein/predicted outer membrane repeat protein